MTCFRDFDNEPSCSMKAENFFTSQISQLLKEDSAHYRYLLLSYEQALY
jgi:hypothetical protein